MHGARKDEMRTRQAYAIAALLAACDAPPLASIDAGSDAYALADSYVAPPDAWTPPFHTADHAAAPIVPDLGGIRLTHPQLVVITFADDPNRATLEAHARWLVGSAWLTSVGAEYGVGAGSILANVERTDAAPNAITSTNVEALLSAGLADHSLPTGADGTFDGVVYVIYFPAHTSITDPTLGNSCHAYGGYHYEGTSGGRAFSYAVVPACHAFSRVLGDLDAEEEVVAHEIIEAATDPRPSSAPAYSYPRTAFSASPWLFVGPELGDLCALRVSDRSYVREGAFVAPRVWSNAAAMANDRDPCVPADAALPYASISIAPYQVRSASPGASTTFDIAAWSTAPVAPYRLYAVANGGTFVAAVSLDRTMVNNGDHATLTVSVPAGSASGSYGIVYLEIGRSMTDYEAFPVVVIAR